MTLTVILTGDRQRVYAKTLIDQAKDDALVTIRDAKVARSIQQNATLHMWFGEIAEHQADIDAVEVKGMCHRRWGLAIKLRDPQFAWVWHHSGAHLDYEKQCKLLASGVLNVSSSMSVDELGEYMDAMFRHFTNDGIALTDPEARKWEGVS